MSLHVADGAPLTLGPPLQREQGPVHAAVLDLLAGGGGHFFVDIARAVSQRVIEPATERQLRDALWELTWSGQVTGDTFAPLRGRLVGGRTSHRARTQPTPRGRYAAGPVSYTHLTGKRVILVDDVMTTGASLDECARTLKLRCV